MGYRGEKTEASRKTEEVRRVRALHEAEVVERPRSRDARGTVAEGTLAIFMCAIVLFICALSCIRCAF